MKKKYFKEKKRRFNKDQQLHVIRQTHREPNMLLNKDVFTGGGFKVTQVNKAAPKIKMEASVTDNLISDVKASNMM